MALALIVIVLLRPPSDEVSDSFCELYPNITKMTTMLERGLEGEGRPNDLRPANYRALADLVWSDRVAAGGPDELDADAGRIAEAVRRAATEEDAEPLRSTEVQRAIERVEAGAQEACDGRER
jgi:hypothetical protein